MTTQSNFLHVHTSSPRSSAASLARQHLITAPEAGISKSGTCHFKRHALCSSWDVNRRSTKQPRARGAHPLHRWLQRAPTAHGARPRASQASRPCDDVTDCAYACLRCGREAGCGWVLFVSTTAGPDPAATAVQWVHSLAEKSHHDMLWLRLVSSMDPRHAWCNLCYSCQAMAGSPWARLRQGMVGTDWRQHRV